MAYTRINFVSKKALKEAVASGQPVRCYQPGIGPSLDTFTGTVALEGPHYPKPHKWYASAQLVDGIVVSVR
jgi:hypothetical protein